MMETSRSMGPELAITNLAEYQMRFSGAQPAGPSPTAQLFMLGAQIFVGRL
jgi:hypothetical protein